MENERYSRQRNLYGWDDQAQEKLGQATVFVAGLGGLGSPATLYLAAAGIGNLILCDADTVQLSNLNRQVLYRERDIGREKAVCAEERLGELNSSTRIDAHAEKMDAGNVAQLVADADIMLDCLDNFEGRKVLNDFSLQSGTPLVHAGVTGLNGQVSFLSPPLTPCLKCIYPDDPVDVESPVLGAVAGLIGTVQAMEAIKDITGTGQVLKNRMLILDGESMSLHEAIIERNPECEVCGAY